MGEGGHLPVKRAVWEGSTKKHHGGNTEVRLWAGVEALAVLELFFCLARRGDRPREQNGSAMGLFFFFFFFPTVGLGEWVRPGVDTKDEKGEYKKT